MIRFNCGEIVVDADEAFNVFQLGELALALAFDGWTLMREDSVRGATIDCTSRQE
jgi:hypothetical protein